MGVNNCKHWWLFIPKCIQLNSESKPKLILVLSLGLCVTQDPDPLSSFLGVECLIGINFSKNLHKLETIMNGNII